MRQRRWSRVVVVVRGSSDNRREEEEETFPGKLPKLFHHRRPWLWEGEYFAKAQRTLAKIVFWQNLRKLVEVIVRLRISEKRSSVERARGRAFGSAKRPVHAQSGWRRVMGAAINHGIPVPCLSAALNYFDGFRTARLPANLLQAQRDYFGAHTYERLDQPRGEFFHTNWTGRGGDTASTTYDV